MSAPHLKDAFVAKSNKMLRYSSTSCAQMIAHIQVATRTTIGKTVLNSWKDTNVIMP